MGAAMCAKRGGEGERWRRHEPRGCAPSRFEVDCWEAGPAGRGPDDWVWSAADANEQPWYEQLCRFVLAHEAADYGGLRSAQIAGTYDGVMGSLEVDVHGLYGRVAGAAAERAPRRARA